MTGGAALATDQNRTPTRPSPQAKAAQQAASAVGGEWRDTGKLIGEAEKRLRKATSARLSTSPNRRKAKACWARTRHSASASRQPVSLQLSLVLTAHETPAPVAGFFVRGPSGGYSRGSRIRPHTRPPG